MLVYQRVSAVPSLWTNVVKANNNPPQKKYPPSPKITVFMGSTNHPQMVGLLLGCQHYLSLHILQYLMIMYLVYNA